MTIGDCINRYNEKYSPYMKNLVNHLPMGQLALYQMTDSVEKAEEYARYFTGRFQIDPVDQEAAPAASLEECVGMRDQYARCLPLTRKLIRDHGLAEAVAGILNPYMSGMSSGLFHVLIRLAYAVEGAELDESLEEETARALAYYVTAYREAGLLERRIDPEAAAAEMQALVNAPEIRALLEQHPSLGKKLKALYESPAYREKGFLFRGTEGEKVRGLLRILVPAFMRSNNIVVLHGITGLHALLNLKEHFQDFDRAFDVYTTCCLSHLLTVDKLDYHPLRASEEVPDWRFLLTAGSRSRDVHTIKFTYTCHQLENRHGYTGAGLQEAAAFRIGRE
jgi:hypothetical protein